MRVTEYFPPSRSVALERIHAVRPNDYASSRNFLDGAVTGLSPYITHGLVSLSEVHEGVTALYELNSQHKFLMELGWREYFNHVWIHRGEGIFQSLHEGLLSDSAYAQELPVDVRQANTGLPVIDMAVQVLYNTGYLHNHDRMWLASYLVQIRKVHWRVAADWLYGHLLDGDLASNHLSWQWVAGTGSSKPYLFNAENVARYAPEVWHSPQSVVDVSYEDLDRMARNPGQRNFFARLRPSFGGLEEPPLFQIPPMETGWSKPKQNTVNGCEVWLVHPWNLGDLPATLPEATVVIGVLISEFHERWPWSERRWQFVNARMDELASIRWHGSAQSIQKALEGAKSVRSSYTPHLGDWLPGLAECEPQSQLFKPIGKCCNSFSKWWKLVSS